jgi:tetratricopeptide (TPR) repeat protein
LRVLLAIDKEKILSLAQRYILKGQSKKAIQEYLKLIEVTPKDKRLYLKLGDLYLKNGENEKAIKEYLNLADLYVEEDLNFRAISIYKRVLSIDPNLIEAFQKIAKLYLKEGLVGSAKSYYQNILELQPSDEEALRSLEDIEGHHGPEEATKRTQPPASVTPEYRQPTEKKIAEETSLSTTSPNTPPMVTYETEISSSEKDSEMHYHLGIAYKEMELYDYAVPEFELALSNPSMKFDCYIMLGSCFLEKGDYDKSIEYYKTASQMTGLPDDKLARLYFNLGVAYESSGMISEAMNAFNQVLKLDQTFQEAQKRIEKLHAEKA